MSTNRTRQLTDAQEQLLFGLDDAAEHVAWEFDPTEWEGIGTCGFAHIRIPDGRCSFVRRAKALAHSDNPAVQVDQRVVSGGANQLTMSFGRLELSLGPSHRSGYRLSITNVQSLANGPSYQRIDLRERLHKLLLERLQSKWGFLEKARVYTRMD